MKESKKKLVVLAAVVLFLPLLWFGTAGKPALAAAASTENGIMNSHGASTRMVDRAGYPVIKGQVLNDNSGGNGSSGGNSGGNGSSGVEKLDEAANRTNKLVTWVCAWIGGLMALFGIIWAAINQASHNSEGRNQGIIVGAIGIVVAFAPQITNMILGR